VWGDDDLGRLRDALSDLVSPSLFGGTGLLVVRRTEALAAASEEVVLEVLPRLGEGARLVLVAKALDQRRRLHVACSKVGAAIGFPRVTDTRAAMAWVTTLARDRGHAIGGAAVERLVARTGTDLARIDDEIEKLGLHVGPTAPIEVGHVDAIVAASRIHAIDELGDRLARRDGAGAIRVLRELMRAGEAPLRIVAFLAMNLRRGLHVGELIAGGLREDEVAGRLGMPAWLVGRYAQRGNPRDIERALAALATLDMALKSSRPDEATFEATVLTITGGRRVQAG